MIRLLLVDDQPLVRAGLRALLSTESDLSIAGEAEHGQQALDWMAEHQTDMALVDIRMPVLNGIECTRRIRIQHPAIKIILLTTFDDERDIAAGLAAGAQGFLLKDASAEEMTHAIRLVAAGERYIQPLVASSLQAVLTHMAVPAPPPYEPLTAREQEVLALLARGMSNKRVAVSLDISENTVKVHVARILAKLGAADRLSALRTAFAHGLITGHP